MPVTIGGSGPITGVTSINTSVSDTELGYLDGVSSALQTQINAKFTTPGGWTTFTPSLTAATTSPTLGTGGSIGGRYQRIGNLVIAQLWVTFGSSGVNAGANTYFMSAPLSIRAESSGSGQYPIVGKWWGLDSSTGTRRVGICYREDSTKFVMQHDNGANQGIGATIPWTWAAGDWIGVNLSYETDAA